MEKLIFHNNYGVASDTGLLYSISLQIIYQCVKKVESRSLQRNKVQELQCDVIQSVTK